jgi:aromatic ring-opening dioxygenase LigB subunit
MPLVYGCITPHGDEIVPKLAGARSRPLGPTISAMKTMVSEMKKARPDTIVLASPHSLRVLRHIAVVTSENSTGSMGRGRSRIEVRAKCDVGLAKGILAAAEEDGLPVVGANYGTFEGELSDLPMDWGTLIPLWYFLGKGGVRSRIVIVCPSREIPVASNFRFGSVVAKVAAAGKRRVAFVASADQAHAHRRDGPYGFSRRAAEYDARVVDAINGGRLKEVLTLPAKFVGDAKPDSLWQMAMLAGAEAVVPMRGRLLSYQVPTYFGMLCASFQPR